MTLTEQESLKIAPELQGFSFQEAKLFELGQTSFNYVDLVQI